MKKMLLEYINIFAYALTGLVFGFSFFLLFINFYHYRELSTKVDVSSEVIANEQKTQEKLDKIKTNINSYQQNSYQGKNNVYDMNSIQIKLNNCVKVFESNEYKELASKQSIELSDVYKLGKFYQNNILNDCVVMQLNAFIDESNSFNIESLKTIRPFIKTTINEQLSSNSYITSNLESADNYYFTNDISKSSIFFLAKDSYNSINTNYQNTLDLLVELSNWYYNEVMGG